MKKLFLFKGFSANRPPCVASLYDSRIINFALIALVAILWKPNLYSQSNCDPPADPCNLVINGDFEQNTITQEGVMTIPFYPQVSQICNWYGTGVTPFTHTNSDGTSVGLFMTVSSNDIPSLERITAASELQLSAGKTYTLTFDYLIGTTMSVPPGTTPPTIVVGLTNGIILGDELPPGATTIAVASSPLPNGFDVTVTQIITSNVFATYPDGSVFNHFEGTFVYSGDGNKYLNVTGTNSKYEIFPGLFSYLPTYIFVDNISIATCDVVPLFSTSVDGCTVSFTANDPECQHFWDFGDGTTFSGPNPPPHTYPGIGGSFEVTHSITTTCGTFTETQTVTPACTLGCECPSDAIQLNANQTSLQALLGNTIPANPTGPVNLIISNELVFDVSYSFPPNSTICMRPNARMVVNGGSIVNFNRTNVKSWNCDKLWKEIAIMANGRLNIANYSVIQDGALGVVVKPGAILTAFHSTFNKNFLGVKVDPNATLGGQSSVVIGYCAFTSNGNLLPSTGFVPPAGSVIPNIGPVGFAGIFSEHSGVLPVRTSHFSNLSNGIVSVGTSFQLGSAECTYRSMLRNGQNALYGDLRGYGIYAKGGQRVEVEGTSNAPASGLDFDDCYIGVHMERTFSGRVRNCKMDNITKAGIDFRNRPFLGNISVSGNNINSDWHGIYLHNLKNTNVKVEDNIIAVSGGGSGIWIGDVQAKQGSTVERNEISAKNASPAAIYMTNSKRLAVRQNAPITLGNLNSQVAGIRLEYCSLNDIECNEISGMGASQTNHFGIVVTESQSNDYSCNMVSSTGTGIMFYGNCDLSKVRGNDLSSQGVGLKYANLGNPNNPIFPITGKQKWNSNEWDNAGNPGAINEADLFNALLSQYFVHSPTGAGNLWPVSPQPNDWFSYLDPVSNPDPNTPIFQCPSTPGDCNITGFTGDGPCTDKAFRLTVANGQLSGGVYQEGWTWMKERYLYRNMKDECLDLINQEPPFASFYNTIENSGPGTVKHIKAFYLADRNTELALEPSANDAAVVEGYQAQAESLSVSLETVLQQIEEQGELPNLVQQRDALLLDLYNLSLNAAALSNSITAGQAQGIAAVAADNSAINTALQVEVNEKTVNDIYFSTLALGNDDFSSTQLVQLQGLANQCPYAGGTAVFKARAMLGGDVSYNDKLLCQTGGGLIKKPNDGSQTSSFVAFPNPAQHEVQLSFVPRDAKGMLVVTDVFGRRVTTQQVLENTVSLVLPTGSWESGVYFLNLVFEGEKPSVQSVIISH